MRWALAVALALACCGEQRPPLERARAIIDDDDGFGTAIESGDSFAHVAELLLDADERAASAWVQVVAVEALECSLPEIHDLRRAVRDHVEAVISSPGEELELPPLPAC